MQFLNTIAAWFKSKNLTAHTICAFLIAAAGIIASDQQVQDFVVALFKAHPALGSEIVAVALIIAKYSHSSSPAGTVANARNILANGSAPTAKQVDAADTKIQ